jgi:DNA-binding CsgD family transcriptional regulator
VAREEFAKERARLDGAGTRPLRAILDLDEAVAIAASGSGYSEAGMLVAHAIRQFDELGMAGWAERSRALISQGFEEASRPGGRLFFSYPVGLSRREVDVVRLLGAGKTTDEAAQVLDVDPATFQRYLAAALDKLGASDPDDLPRLARRHGLGGA